MQKKPNTKKKYRVVNRLTLLIRDAGAYKAGVNFSPGSQKSTSQLGNSFCIGHDRSVSLGNKKHGSNAKGNYAYDDGKLYLQIGSILRAGIFRYCRS